MPLSANVSLKVVATETGIHDNVYCHSGQLFLFIQEIPSLLKVSSNSGSTSSKLLYFGFWTGQNSRKCFENRVCCNECWPIRALPFAARHETIPSANRSSIVALFLLKWPLMSSFKLYRKSIRFNLGIKSVFVFLGLEFLFKSSSVNFPIFWVTIYNEKLSPQPQVLFAHWGCWIQTLFHSTHHCIPKWCPPNTGSFSYLQQSLRHCLQKFILWRVLLVKFQFLRQSRTSSTFHPNPNKIGSRVKSFFCHQLRNFRFSGVTNLDH